MFLNLLVGRTAQPTDLHDEHVLFDIGLARDELRPPQASKTPIRWSAWARVLACLLPAVALTLMLGCATTLPAQPPLPEALQPGAGHRALLTWAARGVQIYECRKAGAGASAWVFVAPEAELLDARGQRVGRHGAGPYWAADDGSRIVGKLLARADAPGNDAIAWLLLSTQSSGGPGLLSRVSHVQRIHTEGGMAPRTGCDAAHLGQQAHVPYRADYRLFVPA